MTTRKANAGTKNVPATRSRAKVVKVEEPKLNPVLSMLQLAMTDSNVDLDKMDKIMQMAERHEAKLAEKSFKTAMAKLQGEMPEIDKDGKIVVKGEVRSHFAKYETIMRAIKKPLKDNNFSVSFKPVVGDGKLVVDCVVSHGEGHTEKSTLELPHDTTGSKNNVQAIGSSMSYAKRYALCLMFNIPTGGEDNDGNKVEAPARELKVLTKMTKNAKNIEELQMLWEGFTSEEKTIAKDIVNVRKSDLIN